MKTRKLGRLSYAHVLRTRDGIEHALKAVGFGGGRMDTEAKRRFSLFQTACRALDTEAKTCVVDDRPESTIGKIGARIGCQWSVLRQMLRELARLANVLPVGEEAERAHRKFFPDGLAFVSESAQVKLHHGKALLAEIEAHEFSPYVRAMLAPIVATLHQEQAKYASALGEKLVAVKRVPALRRLRTEAIAALRAFVDYVEITASDDASRARADQILAPVDLLRAIGRTARSVRSPRLRKAVPRVEAIREPSLVPSRSMPLGHPPVSSHEASRAWPDPRRVEGEEVDRCVALE